MKKTALIIYIVIVCYDGRGQLAIDSLRFTDFHIHSTYKNYYRDVPHPDSIYSDFFLANKNISNWDGEKHRKKYKGRTDFSGFYGKHSYPQASWNMISESPASILCTSISPFEKKFVSNHRVRVSFLKPRLRFINKLLVTKMKERRQKVVYEGHSFNEFTSEYLYATLQKSNPAANGRNVRLVKDAADLRQARKDNETALILSVEGGHTLLGWETMKKEFSSNFGINSRTIGSIYSQINTLKTWPHHIFFITLAHISYNAIAGQAKSLDVKSNYIRSKLSKESGKKKFRVIFRKFITGIDDSIRVYTQDVKSPNKDKCTCKDSMTKSEKAYGMGIMERLLDNSNGQHRILIDIRHMDVMARHQYIEYVQAWNSDADHKRDSIPVIISHAAVNGKDFKQARLLGTCPFADRYDEIRFPKSFYKGCDSCLEKYASRIDLNKTGWFHPFSINLYDEEIKAVYESDGILGITLEERVLGTNRVNYTTNHFDSLYKYFKTLATTTQEKKELKILEPFMRTLLYIIEHSGYAGNIKSWEHIAIGSDFDGFIDPLDVCTRITDIPHFYTLLEKFLPHYAEFLKKQHLMVNEPVQKLLNRLFYENGERFVLKYYN